MNLESATFIKYKLKNYEDSTSGVELVLQNLQADYTDRIKEFASGVCYKSLNNNVLSLIPIWKDSAKKANIDLKVSGFGRLKYLINIMVWAYGVMYKKLGPYKYMLEYKVERISNDND